MNKKHLFIAAIVVLAITLVILFFVARTIQSDRAGERPGTNGVLIGEGEEGAALDNERLLRLTPHRATAFDVTEESVVVMSHNNTVVRLGHRGESLGEPGGIGNIEVRTALVSPTGDIAIQTDGGLWLLFHDAAGQFEALPEHTREVSFSPSGRVLLVLFEQGAEHTLALWENGQSRTLQTFSIPDMTARWINDNMVMLSTRPAGIAPGIAYFFSISQRTTTRILGGRNGLTARASANERFVLFSQSQRAGQGVSFRVFDRGSGEEFRLALSTLPEKCTFSREHTVAYCAVFVEDLERVHMPDDYYKGVMRSFLNSIVRIDLETGEAQIIEEDLPVDAVLLRLTPLEDAIIFQNKNDGILYRLSIF